MSRWTIVAGFGYAILFTHDWVVGLAVALVFIGIFEDRERRGE